MKIWLKGYAGHMPPFWCKFSHAHAVFGQKWLTPPIWPKSMPSHSENPGSATVYTLFYYYVKKIT